MARDELGLVVPGVELAASARAEDHDDPLRARREVCRTRSQRRIARDARYMENAGNLTLEFTIEAPNVGGAGNVLPSEADVAMARRNKGYEHGLPSKKSLR